MKKELEKQKKEAIDKITEEINTYYERLNNAYSDNNLSISMIEKILVDAQKSTKEIIKENGNEAVNTLLDNDVKKNCTKCEEKVRKNSKQKIEIITLAGKLKLDRSYYYCRSCKTSEIPDDKQLGIENITFKSTKDMLVEISFYAQNQPSFKDAKFMINKVYGININEDTVRQIAEYVGEIVHQNDDNRAKNTYENIMNLEPILQKNKKDNTLYILMDGAAVNTRVQDENGSTWRENKLVMAFTKKDMLKLSKDTNLITKKEYSSYIGSSENFKKFVLDVAIRAGANEIKKIVILSDGATWIRNMCKELFPDAIQILDKFHLAENIFEYAKYLYKNEESEYTKWAKIMIDKIDKGNIEVALKMIPEIKGKLPKGVVNLKGYITNNIDKINYKKYKDEGLFVGSGAIESGNKTVVQRRLKQAGMRWSVEGAQKILSLRAKWESNLWKEVTDLICA